VSWEKPFLSRDSEAFSIKSSFRDRLALPNESSELWNEGALLLGANMIY